MGQSEILRCDRDMGVIETPSGDPFTNAYRTQKTASLGSKVRRAKGGFHEGVDNLKEKMTRSGDCPSVDQFHALTTWIVRPKLG